MRYSKTEGLKKTAKNIAFTWGVPALLYVLDKSVLQDVIPDDWMPIVLPLAGAATYFIKNYLENKNNY